MIKNKFLFTFADASTLEIDDSRIVQPGIDLVARGTSDGILQIGGAKCSENNLVFDNEDGYFDDYDFDGANYIIYFKDSDDSDYVRKGVFNIDSATKQSTILNITAFDNMIKFESPFIEVDVTAPISCKNLLIAIGNHCGVPLSTLTFSNQDYVIERLPTSKTITNRQMVAHIAQIVCKCAMMNELGGLILDWYKPEPRIISGNGETDIISGNGKTDIISGNATGYGYHQSLWQGAEVANNDIIVTGIEVKAQGVESDYGETSFYGSEGYVLSISDNPLITEGKSQEVADFIGSVMVGFKFRIFKGSVKSTYKLNIGEPLYFKHKGKIVQSYYNKMETNVNQNTEIQFTAATPFKQLTDKADPDTTYLKKAEEIVKKYTSSMEEQQAMVTSLLALNLGMFTSTDKGPDGSMVYYAHEKPERSESMIIWKFTINARAVSTDGGQTWNAAQDANGNLTAQAIYASLIVAEMIKVGSALGGFTISDEGLTSTFTETFGPFTQDDKDRLTGIVLGTITPIESDYDKYDITRDGLLNSLDILYMTRIMNEIDGPTATYDIIINSKKPKEMIKLIRTGGGAGAGVSNTTILGAGVVSSSYIYATGAPSGSFTTADGKTITVTDGIITNIN